MRALNKTVGKYGFAQDLWVNQIKPGKYMIVDGEHRLLMLREKGVKQIACKVFKLKYPDVQLLRQIANKLRGQHDKKADAAEFKDIYEHDDLSNLAEMLATDEDDFKRILEKEYDDMDFGIKEEGEIPEPPNKPKSKIGDIYKLGRHTLICGDSLTHNYKQTFQMVFTDPPYAILGSGSGLTQLEDDNMVIPFFESLLATITNTLTDEGHAYICCNWRSFPTLWNALKSYRFLSAKNLIVWSKPNVRLGNMYSASHEFILFLARQNHSVKLTGSKQKKTRLVLGETNVWIINADLQKAHGHNAEKPVELVERPLKNSSDKGDLILDMFGGTGTTLIACEKTGRTCTIIEKTPNYVDVIIQRWENLTGKKAKKH